MGRPSTFLEEGAHIHPWHALALRPRHELGNHFCIRINLRSRSRKQNEAQSCTKPAGAPHGALRTTCGPEDAADTGTVTESGETGARTPLSSAGPE